MPTRKRISTRIVRTSGGGGGGPAPGGTISWGPSFGQSAGNDASTWNVGAGVDLDQVNLAGGFDANCAVDLSEVNLSGGVTANCTVDLDQVNTRYDLLQATGAADLHSIDLVGGVSCGCSTDLAEVNLSGATTTETTLGGTVLAAPFWQSVSFNTNPTTERVTLDKPAALEENDLMVVIIALASDTGTTTPSRTQVPSGWTRDIVETPPGATTGYIYVEIYSKLASASEPASYEWRYTGVGLNRKTHGEMHHLKGVDTTTPINASNSTYSTNGTDLDSPSVTTTAANCLVFSVYVHDHGAISQTHNTPTGHVEVVDQEESNVTLMRVSTDYRIYSATGSTGTLANNCSQLTQSKAVTARLAVAPGILVIA